MAERRPTSQDTAPKRVKQDHSSKKCLNPCLSPTCYVCTGSVSPRLSRNYLWLADEKLSSLFVNQNFSGLKELVIVPRQHVGEFRFFKEKNPFWQQVLEVLNRICLGQPEFQFWMEVNYGNWLVHQPTCPHYHAHLHLHLESYEQVVGNFLHPKCPKAYKQKEKYSTDCEVPVPAPMLESTFFDQPFVELFATLQKLLTGIPGFALGMRGVSTSPNRLKFYLRVDGMYKTSVEKRLAFL